MIRYIVCGVSAAVGGLLMAVPNLSNPRLLFAVPLPAAFRNGPQARGALNEFRAIIAVFTLLAMAVLWMLPLAPLSLFAAFAPLGITVIGGFAYYRQYRKLRPYAVDIAPVRETEISTSPDRLPWWAWAGAAGPYALLGATAAYLNANWQSIPARFPVHWGVDGQPNRWVDRSARGVYGPLWFAAELSLLILLMGLAGWFGARRSRHRTVLLAAIIGLGYVLTFIFSGVAVMPIVHVPLMVMVLAPFVIIVPFTIILIWKLKGSSSDPLEPTPLECWKAGVFYYNPNDTALFVEKRFGVGYTLNFANPWCWALLGGIIITIVSAFFILA
jgi:uncharacterized membrane protein